MKLIIMEYPPNCQKNKQEKEKNLHMKLNNLKTVATFLGGPHNMIQFFGDFLVVGLILVKLIYD